MVQIISTYLRRWLSNDPEALLLARDGCDAFVLQTGQRILDNNRGLILLNYCPHRDLVGDEIAITHRHRRPALMGGAAELDPKPCAETTRRADVGPQ
jgi:hypothetical protein